MAGRTYKACRKERVVANVSTDINEYVTRGESLCKVPSYRRFPHTEEIDKALYHIRQIYRQACAQFRSRLKFHRAPGYVSLRKVIPSCPLAELPRKFSKI